MNKTTNQDFENKVKRLNKLQESGLDYIYNLKKPRLTYGFWNRYGYILEDILDDLYENHSTEYEKWCKSNNRWFGHSVTDLMC